MYIFRKNTEGQKSKPGRNGSEKMYVLKSRDVHGHTVAFLAGLLLVNAWALPQHQPFARIITSTQ